MTDLIDSPVFLAGQVSLLVKSVFLEEVANFVSGCKKVVVMDVVFVARGEFGLWEMGTGLGKGGE